MKKLIDPYRSNGFIDFFPILFRNRILSFKLTNPIIVKFRFAFAMNSRKGHQLRQFKINRRCPIWTAGAFAKFNWHFTVVGFIYIFFLIYIYTDFTCRITRNLRMHTKLQFCHQARESCAGECTRCFRAVSFSLFLFVNRVDRLSVCLWCEHYCYVFQ